MAILSASRSAPEPLASFPMNRPSTSLRSARIIPLAMGLGVLAITGGAVAVRLGGGIQGDPAVARTLTMVVVLLALGTLPVYLVLRRTFLARVREQRAEALELLARDQAPPALLSLTILGAALAEGTGIFGAVTVLLGGPWFVLAAPGLALALIVAQIPSRERLEALVRG